VTAVLAHLQGARVMAVLVRPPIAKATAEPVHLQGAKVTAVLAHLQALL
jgi:hypothetical protein